MSRGLFVTGTDTNVGKTVVSAALMHRYRGQAALRYWKPIQTGIETDDDTRMVARLGQCRADEIVDDGVRLARPVSPHLAARWSGLSIAIAPLVAIRDDVVRDGGLRADGVRDARPRNDGAWIVEGAGGALVPINDRETIADLIVALSLAAVVVARTALGTINHTLLTIEALRRRAIRVAGVVLVGPPDPDARAAIEAYGDIVVLGDMPRFSPLTAEALADWAPALDPSGRLLEWLGVSTGPLR